MSGRGKSRNNRNRNQHPQTNEHSLTSESLVFAELLDKKKELVDRYDRHEKLVKLSRDITLESKRIINVLHEAATLERPQEEINAEARRRIEVLIQGAIKAVALELENIPLNLHARAITGGLQEFTEARTLLSIMEKKQIITYSEVQQELVYTVNSEDGSERQICTVLSHLDYMLGLADLSGELMRKAINSISSGDNEECFFIYEVIQKLYAGFVGLHGVGHQLDAKLNTTRSNVLKVEGTVYSLRLRSDESPAELLLLEPQSLAAPTGQSSGSGDTNQELY